MSKLSFQYGLRVFLMTEVVRVCSPPIVATANGSGNPVERGVSTEVVNMGIPPYGRHPVCKGHQQQLL